MIRHKYKGCIASAVLIQKRVRGMQAREFRLLQEVAAITIQRCVIAGVRYSSPLEDIYLGFSRRWGWG